MQFDWTTFVLEVVNFLVLMWILQRFLYKPVANAIARRKAEIDKSLSDAQALQADAEALKHQYENRLADWGGEKDQARARLAEELGAERARMLSALQLSLEGEREKSRALERQHTIEVRRSAREQGLTEGQRFVTRLLSRIACAELEAKIREMLLGDLSDLSNKATQGLRATSQDRDSHVEVTSAYPIGASDRDALEQAVGAVLGKPIVCEFGVDPNVIAGLRIAYGPWVLRANLQDEMKYFAEAARHGHF